MKRNIFLDDYNYIDNVELSKKNIQKFYVIIKIVAFLFLSIFLVIGIKSTFNIKFKINGNIDNVKILDNKDMLSVEEEQELLYLFKEIYNETGVPITFYLDDESWKEENVEQNDFISINFYAKYLYKTMNLGENDFLIVFTTNDTCDFEEWNLEICRGENTIKFFDDNKIISLKEYFNENIKDYGLYKTIYRPFNKILEDLKVIIKNPSYISFLIYPLFVMPIVFIVFSKTKTIFSNSNNNIQGINNINNNVNINSKYKVCQYCGATNNLNSSNCSYCGTLLIERNGYVEFLNPNDIR